MSSQLQNVRFKYLTITENLFDSDRNDSRYSYGLYRLKKLSCIQKNEADELSQALPCKCQIGLTISETLCSCSFAANCPETKLLKYLKTAFFDNTCFQVEIQCSTRVYVGNSMHLVLPLMTPTLFPLVNSQSQSSGRTYRFLFTRSVFSEITRRLQQFCVTVPMSM